MYHLLTTSTIANGAKIRHVFNGGSSKVFALPVRHVFNGSSKVFALPDKLMHTKALTRCFHFSSALNTSSDDSTLKRDLASHINPWESIKAFVRAEIHEGHNRVVLSVGASVITLMLAVFATLAALYRQQNRIDLQFANIKKDVALLVDQKNGTANIGDDCGNDKGPKVGKNDKAPKALTGKNEETAMKG